MTALLIESPLTLLYKKEGTHCSNKNTSRKNAILCGCRMSHHSPAGPKKKKKKKNSKNHGILGYMRLKTEPQIQYGKYLKPGCKRSSGRLERWLWLSGPTMLKSSWLYVNGPIHMELSLNLPNPTRPLERASRKTQQNHIGNNEIFVFPVYYYSAAVICMLCYTNTF